MEVLECFAPLARGLGLDADGAGTWRTWRTRLSPNTSKTRRHSQRYAGPRPGPVKARANDHLSATAEGRPGRWLREWTAELTALPTRRRRARFTIEMLTGMPQLAAVLRCQVTSTGPQSDAHHPPADSHHGVVPLPPEPSNRTPGRMP